MDVYAALAEELIAGAGRPGLLPGLRAIADAHEFERLIADARTMLYADTGHLPMIERPDCFNEDLQAFLG